ncbi:hypothetical protein [Acinetobacter sp. ANC 3813]|uniref:hypothetical protein n=1 Tax=Acinetobacter sp. ANC 3813 TaxID=1977873 RepID=UPI000A356CFD|nr:hypothetical protein [Acinetobacter sp. ANC 3813]OTG87902.1 hypothetical protein B9T34_16340 [Acinetobacter sp. ANC 3813]
MILTELQIENARENARRFYRESDKESVKKVLETAAFLGSYVEFCHVEKNVFFVQTNELGELHKCLYDCTGAGYISKVTEHSGWGDRIPDFIDILELKRLHNEGIKHLDIVIEVIE